jgi:CDGSH-type Zn-finger protein
MDEVTISPSLNGPYLVSGPVHLTAPDGHEIPDPPHFAMCRRERSGNKPFCDGTRLTFDFDGTLAN